MTFQIHFGKESYSFKFNYHLQECNTSGKNLLIVRKITNGKAMGQTPEKKVPLN